MKSLAYTFILFLFTFQACSTQEAHPTTQKHSSLGHGENIATNIIPKKPALSIDDSQGFEEEFQEEDEILIDPLSGYNKAMTTVNDKLYIYALEPFATTYGAIFPEPLRIGFANAIKNLNFPIRFANNILQGKFKNAKDETERFLTNSTIGLLGFMDPATTLVHVDEHKEDFGQTLGFYGVGPGFHIVLPFLGPSNVRDFAGLNIDAYASPLVNIRGLERYEIPNNASETFALFIFYRTNKASLQLGQYQSLKKDAIELYPFLRDVYEAKRRADIEK